VLVGARGLAALVAFGLGGFAAGAAVRQVVLATRRQGWRGLVGRTNGGMIVHVGVVLIAVALAASGSYDTERELTMAVGDTATVAGHEIEYLGARTVDQANKTSVRARVSVDGEVYEPAINRFEVSGQAIGTPSVRTSLTEDVYLTLQRAPDDDAGQTASIRVIVLPLVTWLWIGGGVMAFGTALAAFPGRRRNPIDPVSAPLDTGVGAGPDRTPVGAGIGGRRRSDGSRDGAGAGAGAGDGDGDGAERSGDPRPGEAPDRVEVPT
jgi:cytochrome c-type biogenesis protein CcmF